MSNVKANTEKPKRDKYTWLNKCRSHIKTYIHLNIYTSIVLAAVAIVMLLIGLCIVAGNGFYIFQIFDDYSVSLPLLFITFMQCVGVTWIYGSEK